MFTQAQNQKLMKKGFYFAFTLLFFSLAPVTEAQSVVGAPQTSATDLVREPVKPPFPYLFFTDQYNTYKAQEAARPYWAASETEVNTLAKTLRENTSILLNNDILAFYGHPLSKNMGILGRYSIEELDARLTKLALDYKAVSGGRNVRRAFYIIYGTVWPEGEIGIIRDSVLMEYIQYALDHDILIFLDHQIGRYEPVASLKKLLPYLRYPNVHLALDPEWRTTKPMQEIGRVSAAELNEAQRVMEQYIIDNNLPGDRMLVIHQFKPWMIENRTQVHSNFDKVRLIHCADGFGNPNQKRSAYASNAEAKNIPLKSFKLFYNFSIPGAGYDDPLLSPRDVYALNPRPYLILYQ
ncbi:conserved hypothetical protein [Treponema primitia ZAS-2]|uniref:Lipoprotein n=1 Tax=Treponema primitia (strain ATCC BAA-887 / DSM 12427 / ZAS-2) TaxID=545694 RepID=F5YMI1_TREPZ|nr:hypothetical protein [Treponema primitia]AEF86801.1 conserved hypothetical protein [Treponema primitia ZAS-2]